MERFAYNALYSFGWFLGKLPPMLVAVACRALGALAWHLSPRRRTILGGLARCFPERDAAWRQRIGRENASRLFEMFLLILALPHWSERRKRARIRLDPSMERHLSTRSEARPKVLFVTHSALTEGLSLAQWMTPASCEIVALYRPLDNAVLERYVHWARQSTGMTLVSRREGLLQAKKHLQQGSGAAAILFDQSAGSQGHLMLLFDRLCSTTNLPGLLATRTGAQPIFIRARREGFWRGILEAHPLPASPDPGKLMAASHRFFEDLLRSDDNACADWFWAHKRWKGTLRPQQLFTVSGRKSYVREQLSLRDETQLPRRTHFVFWLDPRPEILPAAHRMAHVVRVERPDAQLWLLVPPAIAENPALPTADRRLPLPPTRRLLRATLRALNEDWPDALFVFDNRPECAVAARWLHCEFSAGIIRPGSPARSYRRSVCWRDADYRARPFAAWRELLLSLELDEQKIARILRQTMPPLPSAAPRSDSSK